MISLDSETTGVDVRHAARPFFVTICREERPDEPDFWEWDVDPLTREVRYEAEDLFYLWQEIAKEDSIVLQNSKFDAGALRATGTEIPWPWERTHDTLLAGHILASGVAHDLTSMSMQYLGVDIKPWEDALEEACKECRKMARKEFPEWKIAKKEMDGFPSIKGSKEDKRGTTDKDKLWKNDSWLPRAMAKELGLSEDHIWWTVLRDYSNTDSSVTLALWKELEEELHRNGLWEIYDWKRKSLASIFEMEQRGVTILTHELKDLRQEYFSESEESEGICVGIARRLGHDLVLPKAGNNKSLTSFCFGPLALPIIKRTETGAPSLDKEVIEEYKGILDGEKLQFIRNLSAKRKRAKSNEFLDTYEKYGIEISPDIVVLYPSANPTGTATTRFSMSNPNLQQVSKQETECEECRGEGCEACGGTGEDLHSVRRVFGPAPGREWWTADAQNIELRIPAYVSGEPDLIALFERPKEPPFYGSQHLLNMSVVFEDIWQKELKEVGIEKVGPHCKKKYASSHYQSTKNGDFAIQYQCGEATADATFRRKGAYRKLKAKFSRLDDLNRKTVVFAEKHGYVETLLDKSLSVPRGYPLMCSRGEWGRIISTTPLNYKVQGTAGWWMIKAMVRCYDQLSEWKPQFDAFMCLTVHDELIFDMPAGHGKEPWKTNLPKMRCLQRLMSRGGEDIGVPTPVSVEYHPKNWAEGKVI